MIEVKALITKENGKFLMLRRGKDWNIPGKRAGKKKSTVTLLEAVKESCGLKVEIIRPVKMYSYKEKGRTIFAIVFLCQYRSGKVRLGKGYSSFKWAGSEEEPEY